MKVHGILIGVFLIGLCPNASGQEPPAPIEVFGGYSYERHGVNMNGWRGSVTWNRNDWLGLVADTSGQYAGFNFFSVGGVPARSSLNSHTFLVGPKFSLRTNSRITPFSQFLAGLTRQTASAALRDGSGRGQSRTRNGFAMAAGGGFDLRMSDRLALRVAQADYSLWRLRQRNSNGIRFSAGPVFGFGR
jgi:hypothetical protein